MDTQNDTQEKNKSITERRGFFLLETIFAIFIILAGLIGVLIVTTESTRTIRIADNRMVASHLAQEAVEVVVNIRHSNWLSGSDWRDGIPATTNGLVAFDSTSVSVVPDRDNRCVRIVDSVYQHDGPPCNTPFFRTVEIIERQEMIGEEAVDFIEVRAIVEWQSGLVTRSVMAVHHLYDWR